MIITQPGWRRIGGVLVAVALATAPLCPAAAYAAESADKAETVHVDLDATGSASSVTVEDLLANDAHAETLSDRSTLTDIVPSEDDLTFTRGEGDALTWSAGGEQVTYEGASTDALPVSITTTFKLDGEEVPASQLAGATGHLVMRISYENHSSSMREVGGKQAKIYTPFVCLTVAALDSEVFSNVQVENGRIVGDKGGTMVIGYALPGLKESLDLDEDDIDLDLPEYLQIEADVTDLALDPIYTIVTPELFGELDTSDLDLGDLGEGTDELQDAMAKLVEGSSNLTDALEQLADGSEEIGGGVAAFKEQIGLLPQGMSALAKGAKSLSKGLGEAAGVIDQMDTAASGLVGLASGAGDDLQAVVGAVGTAGEKVGAAYGSVATLKATVGTLDLSSAKDAAKDAATTSTEASNAAREAAEALKTQATVSGTDAVADDISAAQDALKAFEGIDTEGMTEEQVAAIDAAKSAAKSAADSLADAQEDLDAVTVAAPDVSAQVEALNNAAVTLETDANSLDAASSGIATVTSGADDALTALGEATGALAGTEESFTSAGTSLTTLGKTAYGLSYGLSGVNENFGTAVDGAAELAKQLGGLSDSAPQIVGGVDALSGGIDTLTGALNEAAKGSGQLTDGLSTFNDQGISEIVSALEDLDGDVNGITDRLDALRDAADAYDTFSGKAEGQSGSVRFIYKTERIG